MPGKAVSGGLVMVDGYVGERKDGEFKEYTNYSIAEVICAISSAPGAYTQLDGFLYRVKLVSGETR